MADDEIEVAIEGEDAPAGAEGAANADPVADLKSQFDDLKARAERDAVEKAAALARASRAEAAAQQAQREVASVRTEAIETRAESLDSGIASANEAIAAAEREIQTASESGDHAAAAKAHTKLAKATARLERLTGEKASVEIAKTEAARPVQRTEAPQPGDTASGDPFEDYVSKFTAPTAQWMRDHKEWVTDGRKSLKLTAAHNDALADGLSPDTPAYFDHVEKFIGLKKAAEPETKPNGKDAVTVKTHQRRAPVAPVSNGSNGYGGGDNVVKLSKQQAEAATDGTIVWNYDDPSPQKRFKKGDPIGVQEYARRVKTLKDAGAFDPNNISI